MKTQKLPPLFMKLTESSMVQKILANEEKEMHLKMRHFQFIILQMDESNLESMGERIGKITDTFLAHKAFLGEVSSSLITGFFGFPRDGNAGAEKRFKLVTDLLKINGNSICIVHGQTTGLVGLIGGKDSYRYGAIIPNFSNILITLLDSPFGAAKEIPL